MEDMSQLKLRYKEAFSLSFGMCQKVICMQLVTLALVEWLQEHITFGHDSAENLAVLHNQNHMVREFGMSAWVAQSNKQVISRSVTSCAGMTAYMVVVAQTKVGFLTGGRGQKFRDLPEEERRTQEEEAYARATVALTRARKMCVVFCPLDMKGLLGAATVMGSLMYGAGHCWKLSVCTSGLPRLKIAQRMTNF